MPETPEELYARAREGLLMPPVEEWETFPFEGEIRVRPLLPPAEQEPPRIGEGGVDCPRCARPDEADLWTTEHWRLTALPKPRSRRICGGRTSRR